MAGVNVSVDFFDAKKRIFYRQNKPSLSSVSAEDLLTIIGPTVATEMCVVGERFDKAIGFELVRDDKPVASFYLAEGRDYVLSRAEVADTARKLAQFDDGHHILATCFESFKEALLIAQSTDVDGKKSEVFLIIEDPATGGFPLSGAVVSVEPGNRVIDRKNGVTYYPKRNDNTSPAPEPDAAHCV